MQSAAHFLLLCKTRPGQLVVQAGGANVPWEAGWGAALVVKFAATVVLGAHRRPKHTRAQTDVALEGPLEGPDVAKTRSEGDADNRVVLCAQELHGPVSSWCKRAEQM